MYMWDGRTEALIELEELVHAGQRQVGVLFGCYFFLQNTTLAFSFVFNNCCLAMYNTN